MRRVCISVATAVALLSNAWAGPESDSVGRFGLPGVWRLDRTKPAGALSNRGSQVSPFMAG
jgi:hypothetical protein